MSFARDGSQICPVRWYRTAPGAPDLGFKTPFRSLAWWHQDQGPADVLGEVIGAARPIADGLPLLETQNEVPCGTASMWHDGFETATFPPGPTVYGTNACCGLPAEPFVHYTCHSCPNGSWSVYTLIVQGGTGSFAGYNGTFPLTYRGGCTWASNSFLNPGPPPSDFIWQARVNGTFPTNSLRVMLLDLLLPDTPTYMTPNGHDCLEFTAVPPLGLNPPDSPPTVVLLPGIASVRGPFCPAQGAFLASELLVRCPLGGIGLGGRLAAQDALVSAVTACNYAGIIWWQTGRFPTFRIPVARPLSLEFLAGDLAVLLFRSIYGFQVRYQGIVTHPWDLTPVPLLYVDGPPGGGLPPVLTLYTQDDLPP